MGLWFFSFSDRFSQIRSCAVHKQTNKKKIPLQNSLLAPNMQLCVWVCVCVWGGRKGGGGYGFRGRAPVWDTCCMECWARTKQMGALHCCVGDLQQTPCTPPPPPTPPSPPPPPLHVSRHKSMGAILRDQNEAGTDNLVWTQHCRCCLSQLGRQILKVCVSFLSLWNIHCSAQEVAIQIINAVSDSCRHHKVSWVQYDGDEGVRRHGRCLSGLEFLQILHRALIALTFKLGFIKEQQNYYYY